MFAHLEDIHSSNFKNFCHQVSTYLPINTIPIHLVTNDAAYICGAHDNNVYLVESGSVKIVMIAGSGKECLLDICIEGDIVGESCLCCAGRRMEAIIAMTPCVLRAIPRTLFLEIIIKNGLFEESLQFFASKLFEQQEIIKSFVTVDSEQRLAITLLRLGHKLGNRQQGKILIYKKITQEELAGIVGTTRSRIGYFLKRFRSMGLIELTPDCFLTINELLMHEYIQVSTLEPPPIT